MFCTCLSAELRQNRRIYERFVDVSSLIERQKAILPILKDDVAETSNISLELVGKKRPQRGRAIKERFV